MGLTAMIAFSKTLEIQLLGDFLVAFLFSTHFFHLGKNIYEHFPLDWRILGFSTK